VINVSWDDATDYSQWLSKQTGHEYRLPTEAEWEYAARAGTETAQYWGNNPDDACRYANVYDNTSKKNGLAWPNHNCTDGYAKTAPIGSFEPNGFGLFDMLGNVSEQTCSEYEDRYTTKKISVLVRKAAALVRSAVVRGSTNRGTCGQRTVTGARMAAAATTWGFASPGFSF